MTAERVRQAIQSQGMIIRGLTPERL
ncbi:MAG: hypothetical protein RL376_1713, partial [Verrucomicrobiota bacterium]